MYFFIYHNWKNWRVLKYYLLPKWMNPITWKEENKQGIKGCKVYRWLIFGWTI